MKFLFPIICFAYATLFYVFFHFDSTFIGGFFPNTLFNAWIFIILALLFLLFFSDISKHLHISKVNNGIIKKKKDKEYYKQYFKEIFLNYSHYLSYIFFYIGVFVVVKFIPWVYFSYCLFAANIFVVLFFLIFKNLSFSLDFLRINQLIFSLIYLWSYIYILFTGDNFFSFIDFVNSFIIILSFLFILNVSPSLKQDSFFIWNFYAYVYGFIMFYLSFIFEDRYIYLTVTNIFLSVWIISLSQYIPEEKTDTKSLRLFGVVLGYIGCLIGIVYLLQFSYNNIFIYFALIIWIVSNFLFHKLYQNYISYFFSIVTFSALLFVPSFWNIDWAYNFIFVLFFSYFLVWISFLFSEFYTQDSFFLHLVSYIYNFAWISLFFMFFWPSFLQVAMLMFIEFLYFFISYYKLSPQRYLLKTSKSLE